MLPTEDSEGRADDSVGNLDTLSAQDIEPDANLDDSLLRRDLKSRIFGAATTVHIGRYEVLRRIGRGGMGTVYVAHDPELDRKVALKILRADRHSGRDRMLAEARALARLTHPNVVTVHEVGVHDDRVFVAMEFVEGVTLRSWLERSPSRADLWSVFAQAARGLQAAHHAGLVHRDFKPENLLIGDDGRVRVVDFGVVKAADSLDPERTGGTFDSSSALPDLTLTGQLLGTPAYMAAEQFLGSTVDARTDVFAFCVTLYEAVTGRRPFAGNDVASVSRSVLAGEFEPLVQSDVPEELVAFITRGLSCKADDRPRSMDGLALALDRAMAPTAPQRSWVRTAATFAAATAGTLVLAGGAFAALFVMQPVEDDPQAAAAVATTGEEPGVEASADPASDAAFAAIVAASDENRRRAMAERFLEEHGQTAPEARRAIAHSIIGDVLWRMSCPTSMLGLCVEQRAAQEAAVRCEVPPHGPLRPLERDQDQVQRARIHLDQALGLAGVEPPEDPAEREQFATAIGRARVQQTDAKLEIYLGIQMPENLDFEDASDLSSEAFQNYYLRSIELGGELIRSYAAVKKAKSPQWVLAAAARTGLLSEKFATELGNAPFTADFSAQDRRAYCEAITKYSEPPLKVARDAYTYCVKKADQFDAKQPEVEFCRGRLMGLERTE